MKRILNILTIYLLLVDLITKELVDTFFRIGESTRVFGFFSVTKLYNDGASWNMLSGHTTFLVVITIITLLVLFVYERKFRLSKRVVLAFAFLYSGILGNLFNRIFYQHVIDFIDFNFFGFQLPIFNFADFAIIYGVIRLIRAINDGEDIYEFNFTKRWIKNR